MLWIFFVGYGKKWLRSGFTPERWTSHSLSWSFHDPKGQWLGCDYGWWQPEIRRNHPLRLVVEIPLFTGVSYTIPGGCLGFQPSTVGAGNSNIIVIFARIFGGNGSNLTSRFVQMGWWKPPTRFFVWGKIMGWQWGGGSRHCCNSDDTYPHGN